MNKLTELDKAYCSSISSSIDELVKVKETIHHSYTFNLQSTEVSEAILERLKSFYVCQQGIKKLLNKRYQTAGADFFVETVIFFLQAYINSTACGLEVHSERQIVRARNAIRPDISVWKGEHVLAIIECKTQLGWNRSNWEEHFEDRELKLRSVFPEAHAFLLVMTGNNWGGFGKHSLIGQKYFCLLEDVWPPEYRSALQIMTPVESLFAQLYELA